jgi:signal transduction histidine kinase
MPGAGRAGNHGNVTTTVPTVRRLYRATDHGVLGGVAAGIAEHLAVSARVIRIVFLVLCAAGGLGLALYGVYWIVLPPRPGAGPSRLPTWLEYVIGAVVAAIAVGSLWSTGAAGSWLGPILLACVGGALIWRQATDPQRDRWARSPLFAGYTDRLGRFRLAAGGVCVLAGAALVLARADFTAVRDGLLAMVVTAVGLALVTGPWWMRLMGQLSAERSERIRSQERADIAAHLHDSVLQTLALIQRNAESPREVARLARGQERELRNLLYGARTSSGQLGQQLRTIAGEVEDAYAISVDVVLVGDAPMDDRLDAAVAASREALVNAAKHARVSGVSLYAEAEADSVSIFVKDRGIGFDPQTIADDRQGVRGSIVGRVERHGGSVELRTAPGSGTEVQIRMPTR